jgi:hypothetical protein
VRDLLKRLLSKIKLKQDKPDKSDNTSYLYFISYAYSFSKPSIFTKKIKHEWYYGNNTFKLNEKIDNAWKTQEIKEKIQDYKKCPFIMFLSINLLSEINNEYGYPIKDIDFNSPRYISYGGKKFD